jgi:glyoxylase-like metal-dependent hydrolase (beta-lactamase superfamily II)
MILNLPIGIVGSNCIIIYDKVSKIGAVVDPGILNIGPVTDIVNQHNLEIAYVLNTHGHFDHTAGNHLLCPPHTLAIHPEDQDLLLSGGGASLFGLGSPPPSPPPDMALQNDDIIHLGETNIQVIHTPGHTPGSVSFYVKQEQTIVTGDTLFQGGVGRTDLPGGNEQKLLKSLELYLSLPDSTIVIPGHGSSTTIQEEKQYNPWIRYITKG